MTLPFVATGLPDLGHTRHFRISYDDASGLDGREAATALAAMCTDDYDLMTRWFGETSIGPVDVGISTVAARAGTAPPADEPARPGGIAIYPGPSPSPARIRYLFVEEASKLFMRVQDRGWLDAGGQGHGLSLARFLGAQALAASAMGAPDLDLQPANAWMQSPREDFVNNPGGGEAPDGCRVLFLYYLEMQLKYGVDQIVRSGGPTVADAYRTRTHKDEDPFPEFKALLDGRFPGTNTIPDHPDNPWPIGHLADDLIDPEELPIIGWGQPIIDWDQGRFMRP